MRRAMLKNAKLAEGGLHLIGEIYKDSDGRFDDGERVFTSRIVQVIRTLDGDTFVKTMSGTLYHVEWGEPRYEEA